ncbi:MAG TPA: sulfatase [Candidatus Gallacutalibacter stercoravium]|nr:sulfatase [Candidatus Gallacutalibacter stercoravium]
MSKAPNLLYVFADQLRYFSCGYAGDARAQTPHIDAFARQSSDCCNAVSGHPVCAPYRASLFTGKYTTSTGMVINEIRMNPDHECIGHVLGRGGYRTGYIGKWHLYANEMGNHYDPKNSYIPAGPDRLGFDDFFAGYNFHHEYYGEHAYYHLNSPEKIYVQGYEPDAQTDLAIDKMREFSGQEKPFALFLSMGTPHDPWTPDNVPAKYLERFKDVQFELPPNYLPENDPHADDWAKLSKEERAELTEWMRVYYAMVANVDDNFGRLLQAVEDMGLKDDTIVVFTSDHGELFGAHGRRAKNIFYEEAVRIPFLIRWPGRIPAGEKCDVCLNTVDIMPTLLHMMGLPIPSGVEGMDVSERLMGRPGPEPDAALMMCTGPTATFADGNEWRALRDKQYTYAVFHVDGQELLFNNVQDPYQMNNLADQQEFQPLLEQYRQKLKEKMKAIGDTFPACSYYEKNWIRDRLILKTATLHTDMQL